MTKTKTGVSHTDTASGEGGGQMTQAPGTPERKVKKAEPVPLGQLQAEPPRVDKPPKAPKA